MFAGLMRSSLLHGISRAALQLPAVNTVAPSISGTRGGTLTATPGTWTGASSLSGQWYADGVATGNTTTSFTDSDTSKSLEYRETALPGSVVASGYLGTLASPPLYSETFDSYADGTMLAARYLSSNDGVTYTATPTPHVAGWDAIGSMGSDNLSYNALGINGGKLTQLVNTSTTTPSCAIVRDLGKQSVIVDWTLDFEGSTSEARWLIIGAALHSPNPAFNGPDGIELEINNGSNIRISGAGLTAININGITWSDGSVLRTKLDAVGKRIWAFVDGTAAGDPAGYDLSAYTGPWGTKVGIFATMNAGTRPPVGQHLVNAIVAYDLATNAISSVPINPQSGGSAWQKQIDITASIPVAGATGAQYKIETEAGALVQGWTTMTFASGTATASYLIADHAFEGQKFRVLVRNIGGTVNTASALTATNGYVLDAQMRVGMNDQGWASWQWQTPGRDWFEGFNIASVGIIAANPTTADRQGFNAPGMVQANYHGWAETYNAALSYPVTTGTDDHNHARYQGLSWQTTDNTSKVRAAPSTANLSGAGADWKLASDGPADASLVNLTANGLPTKLPDDTNLSVYFEPPYWVPSNRAGSTITVHCKTQPGVAIKLWNNSLGTLTMANQNIPAGTFDLVYAATTPGNYNGILIVDRANSTATLDSTFFLSGIATYETGTPAADIGVPYMAVDKLADLDAFDGLRYVKPSIAVERGGGGPWSGTMTAANNTVGGVFRQWKYIADSAIRLGHRYIHLNIPDGADSTFITAMATFFRDYSGLGSILILPEFSNERWNPIYQGTADLNARANALPNTDAAYQKPYLLHCRDHNAMVAIWKGVFGAAYATRVAPILAWQSVTAISTWQQMLDFENTYQNVSLLAIAPYLDSGIGSWTATPNVSKGQDAVINAVSTSNQTAFNSALSTFMTNEINYEVGLAKALFDWLPGYSMSKGLSKNAIQMYYYEAGWFPVISGSWNTGLGAGAGARAVSYFSAWMRSSAGGAAFGTYIDQLAQKAPGRANIYVYVGEVSGNWGIMDRPGATTQEPYATIKTKALAYNV